MATRKQPPATTEIVKWDEELAKYARLGLDDEKAALSGGSFIGTRAGVFSVKGTPLPGPLDVIIVGDLFENAYYEGSFDPEALSSPVCFAFSAKSAKGNPDVAPHKDSAKPQHVNCLTCPKNAFGSALKPDGTVGKGKACGNRRRLALLLESDLKNLDAASAMYLRVAPTSAETYAKYSVDLREAYSAPPWGFVTRITLLPDAKKQFSFNFAVKEQIKRPEHLKKLLEIYRKQQEAIAFPYSPPAEAPPSRPAATATGKPNKFAPAAAAGKGRR